MLPPIIGLYSSYPRMGKTTVAKILVHEFGYTLLKFSAPIKNPLYELGLSEQEIEGGLKDQPCARLNGITPREKMHEISQKIFQENGNDFLSEVMRTNLDLSLSIGQHIVIDDVRFQENYDLIRSYHRAQIWKMVRDNLEYVDSYDTRKLDGQVFDICLSSVDDTNVSSAIRQYLGTVA